MRPQSQIAFDYKPRSRPAPSHRHAIWFVFGLLLPLAGAIVVYFLRQTPDRQASAVPAAVTVDLPSIAPIEIEPIVETPRIGTQTDYVVRRNDTFDRIFRQLNLSLTDLSSIRRLDGVRESLDKIRPGDRITLIHDDSALLSLTRRISETEVLTIERVGDEFTVSKIATPLEIVHSHASGIIESSLFVSARAAGISPELIMRLANDIFGWKIDFALEIQRGDRFDIVYEQKYRDGEYIGDGRILAAAFVNAGKVHRAVYFKSEDGKVDGYFAPDGSSMRRQFLRAPIDFTRISSNFNPRRRHPILNTIRAHKGVDYAAPTGTIIKAAGDGKVSFVGTQGGYGRVVILEHGGGISTLYAHMSQFAKGLRAGQRVAQGQTIGYVGSSGAATGPHLHYEYRVHGVHKNPRTVPLPDAAPIPDEYRTEFEGRTSPMLAALDRAADSTIVAIPNDSA